MNLELREYGLVLAGAEEGLTISSCCQAKGRFILFPPRFCVSEAGFFQFRIWVPSRQSKAGFEAKSKDWKRTAENTRLCLVCLRWVLSSAAATSKRNNANKPPLCSRCQTIGDLRFGIATSGCCRQTGIGFLTSLCFYRGAIIPESE